MVKLRLAAGFALGLSLSALAAAAAPALAGTPAAHAAVAHPAVAHPAQAADSCTGQTTPLHASTGPAASLQLMGHTSSYVDFQGNTRLLGEVINTGATVESPLVVIDLLNAAGETTSQVDAYLPDGWLEKNDRAPFDEPIAPNTGFTGKWAVDHFVALASQVVPSHNFTISNLTGPTGSGDSQILHGEARNDQSYDVNLIKVSASFFGPCGIIYAEPTVANSNTLLIAPGQEYPFNLPKQTGAPTVDPNNRYILVEANEPGAAYPLTDIGILAAGGKLPTVKATIPTFIKIDSHVPVLNTTLNGVPNPTASDLAGFAHPGTVVPQHDSAPVNSGSDAAQSLVGVSTASPAPRTSAAYAPILLIVVIGAYGLLGTARNASIGWAAFRAKRKARRATLSKLAPGAVGGYGRMPGAER